MAGHHSGKFSSTRGAIFLRLLGEDLSTVPRSAGERGLSKTLEPSVSFLVPTTTSLPPRLRSLLTTTASFLPYPNRDLNPSTNRTTTLTAKTTTKLKATTLPTNWTVDFRQDITILLSSSNATSVLRSAYASLPAETKAPRPDLARADRLVKSMVSSTTPCSLEAMSAGDLASEEASSEAAGRRWRRRRRRWRLGFREQETEKRRGGGGGTGWLRSRGGHRRRRWLSTEEEKEGEEEEGERERREVIEFECCGKRKR